MTLAQVYPGCRRVRPWTSGVFFEQTGDHLSILKWVECASASATRGAVLNVTGQTIDVGCGRAPVLREQDESRAKTPSSCARATLTNAATKAESVAPLPVPRKPETEVSDRSRETDYQPLPLPFCGPSVTPQGSASLHRSSEVPSQADDKAQVGTRLVRRQTLVGDQVLERIVVRGQGLPRPQAQRPSVEELAQYKTGDFQ
jgi:hypothetical protein